MPLNLITEMNTVAVYQKNLKLVLKAAKQTVHNINLYSDFAFSKDEGSAEKGPLLVIGVKDISQPLHKMILATRAKLVGSGACLLANGEMLLKVDKGLNAANVQKALVFGKSPHLVRALEADEQFPTVAQPAEAPAASPGATKPAASKKGPVATKPAPSKQELDAAKLAELKKEIDPGYQKLIEEFDRLLPKVEGTEDEATVKAFRAKIVDKYTKEQYGQLRGNITKFSKLLALVEARMNKREEQKRAYNAKSGQLSGPFDTVYSPASDKDKGILNQAWGEAKKDGEEQLFKSGLVKLNDFQALLIEVNNRTVQGKAQRLAELKQDAERDLPKPTQEESDALGAMEARVNAQLDKKDAAKAEECLKDFENRISQLVFARNQKFDAEAGAAQVVKFYDANDWRLKDTTKLQYKNDKKQLDEEIQSGMWTEAKKRAARMMACVGKDLKDRADAAAAVAEANREFVASMNRIDTEDQAATAWGDSKFTSGMLADIWRAVKKTRISSPPNGSIDGTYQLSEVEAAITAWTGIGSGPGVLTKFFLPGRVKRPQAKWEKDFRRAEVQANFLCKWRSQVLNIHVNVEIKSYFQKYASEVDWDLVPPNIREQCSQ
jgi:hypothetical protein